MSSMLEFQDVCFSYAGRSILQETSFAIAPGECVALIGPNGIGKTTALRLAAGLLSPSAGRVVLGDRDLGSMRRQEIGRSIAMVAQQIEVPFDFSVEQIIQQGRTPYLGLFSGLSAADYEAVEDAMEATRVGYLRDRIFNQLSGGERQRVKIALGLAQEPRLLLLDEPTQNLDIGRQHEIMELIRGLHNNGVTILAAMHDLALIEGSFSAVMLLSLDQPLLHGRPNEVLKPKTLERAFNCPPRNGPKLLTESTVKRDRAI